MRKEHSPEEQRKRKFATYRDFLDYINKYREPDKYYHVTRRENALSLLTNGFDPAQIGNGGGCQGGAGMCFAWCLEDALAWGSRLYGYGCDLAVVRATLPGLKLASQQQCDEMAEAAVSWGRMQGMLDEENSPTAKLTMLYANNPEFADPGWALIGQYVLSQGYDGYFIGIDEVVVMRFELLTANVFELCKEQ
jgi:hypothetical protein